MLDHHRPLCPTNSIVVVIIVPLPLRLVYHRGKFIHWDTASPHSKLVSDHRDGIPEMFRVPGILAAARFINFPVVCSSDTGT